MKKFDHIKARRWIKIAQVVFGVLIVVFILIAVLYGKNPSMAGDPGGSAVSFPELMTALLDKMSLMIGTLAVVMTIAGGVVYATSQGNPNQMNVGRDLIISAISGLALYVFATFLLGDIRGAGGGLIQRYFSF